jgi:small subunit ribosomal protein S4
MSEYGRQLREKQALRAMYGISERQLKHYYRKAMRGRGGAPGERLANLLEARLDNVVYRAGWALSRAQARQFVAHGLIAVDKRRATIPSFQVRKGMHIAVRENKRQLAPFTGVEKRLEKIKLPPWLAREKKDLLAVRVKHTPTIAPEEVGIDLQAVVEFYAR